MKRHLMLLIAVFVTLTAIGERRASIQEAQEVALRYYQKISDDSKGDYTAGVPESVSLLGIADMWLVPVNDCWILVSSDKRTEAILARFMALEKPNLKAYPPAAQYLISCYEHDIAFVRDSCDDCPVRSSWEKSYGAKNAQSVNSGGVAPLLGNMAWKQYGNNDSSTPNADKVYNKYCPSISTNLSYLNNHAAVGCVAVAVGQIMRYWRWPYAAPVPTTEGGSTKELKFYNWDLMLLKLYNSSNLSQVNEVAGFLRDLGYDLGMQYGESSGSTINDAFNTFINFGYDESTLTLRSKWNTSGWTNILHSEIAAGRPVFYRGATLGGSGHAFVLDGYDAGDLYHVNLGWGAYYNDYYFIDTITAGGACYSHSQKAIWGIQPAQSNCTSLTVSSVSTPKFCIAREGLITLSGTDIHNVTDGRVYSETGIRLTTGTHIANGCNVRLAIKPIPCEPPSGPAYIVAHHNSEDHISEIEADKINENQHFRNATIYTIDGKLIKQTSDIESVRKYLPNGIYIIKAITDSGNSLQYKILISK